MMEFKYEHRDTLDRLESTLVLKVERDGDLHQVMLDFRHFLLAAGYLPDSVDTYIGEP